MRHGQDGKMHLIFPVSAQIAKTDLEASHKRQEILLGKHGALGEASCSTCVTKGKTLIGRNFKSLMIDDVLQFYFSHQLPEFEKGELFLQLLLDIRIQLLTEDKIFQVCSTL